MKRIERNTYNSLRKSITENTICVEIPTNYTKEGRQGIHEMLTIEKHMRASSILWNDIEKCYCIHYVPCFDEYDNERRMEQEAQDIDEIMNSLPKSDRTWNGFEKPSEETEDTTESQTTDTTEEQTTEETTTKRSKEDKTMKRTKSMIYNPSTESRELTLYTTNDGRIYDYWIIPVVRNLAKKFAKGTFDPDKAIDAFFPVATAAAKKYCKEFARLEDAPHIFSVTDRFTVAADMVDYYMENIEKNDL